MIRIMAGKHKNRAIPSTKNAIYRPTTAKLREAIFSILTSGDFVENHILKEARVLDIFSGTGSLAFEALSRGASHITLIDSEIDHLKCAKSFAEKIGEMAYVKVLHFNALNLPKSVSKYNLIFIDPPYHKNMVNRTLKSLVQGDWLENQAIMVVEMAKNDNYLEIPEVELLKEKNYGNTKLLLLKFKG